MKVNQKIMKQYIRNLTKRNKSQHVETNRSKINEFISKQIERIMTSKATPSKQYRMKTHQNNIVHIKPHENTAEHTEQTQAKNKSRKSDERGKSTQFVEYENKPQEDNANQNTQDKAGQTETNEHKSAQSKRNGIIIMCATQNNK